MYQEHLAAGHETVDVTRHCSTSPADVIQPSPPSLSPFPPLRWQRLSSSLVTLTQMQDGADGCRPAAGLVVDSVVNVMHAKEPAAAPAAPVAVDAPVVPVVAPTVHAEELVAALVVPAAQAASSVALPAQDDAAAAASITPDVAPTLIAPAAAPAESAPAMGADDGTAVPSAASVRCGDMGGVPCAAEEGSGYGRGDGPVEEQPLCDTTAAVASTPPPSPSAAASRPQVIDLSSSPTLCRSAVQSSAAKQRQQRRPSGDRFTSQPLAAAAAAAAAAVATAPGLRGIQAKAPDALAREEGAAAARHGGSQQMREQPPALPAHEGPWFEVSGHSGRVHLHLAPDGSRPMGLSLPLEALLGVKPQGGGEGRGGSVVGADGAGGSWVVGGGGGEGGRAARDQADQEAAGRRLLHQLVDTYTKQQHQQDLTGLPVLGASQRGASGPVHGDTAAGDGGPFIRHPSAATGTFQPSAAASGGTAAGPSTAFGWHPPAACASLAVSFIGPFGLVSLPAGLDTAWLEAALVDEARAFARDWVEQRAVTRGRLQGRVLASGLADAVEEAAAEAEAAGAYGSSTVRYVQDVRDRPPPSGAEWRTVRVKLTGEAARRAGRAAAAAAMGGGGAGGAAAGGSGGVFTREYQQAFIIGGEPPNKRLCLNCAKAVDDYGWVWTLVRVEWSVLRPSMPP